MSFILSLTPLWFIYIYNSILYKIYYPNSFVSPKSFLFHTKLGNYTHIDGGVIMNGCTTGDYTYLSGIETGGSCSHFYNCHIGKFCSIAHNIEVLPSHSCTNISTYPLSIHIKKKKYIRNQQTYIGNDVWIGANVSIIAGLTIGDGAVIGAGAVVTKDIPPYAVVGGVPTKVIKYRFNKQTISYLLKTQWWNWNINKIIKNIPIIESPHISEFKKISSV